MIRTVRRVQLLTVLMLLLAGLLQPLASAQGLTCSRTHAPANVALQADGSALPGGGAAVGSDHDHAQAPLADDLPGPSASCSTLAVVAESRVALHIEAARDALSGVDQAPASLLARYLFRPPRLS